MNNKPSYVIRFPPWPILCGAAVVLILLALISAYLACGTIFDAAYHGELLKVRLLLKYNPKLVSGEDNEGGTPLHVAAFWGNQDVVELLLSHGADVNARTKDGATPLQEAARAGNKAIAELFLAHGADVNAGSKNGYTALFFAAERGDDDLAETLRRNGATPTAPTNATICVAGMFGDLEMVKSLIKSNPKLVLNKELFGTTPLQDAAHCGYINIVELLVASGADVNSKDQFGTTPLDEAEQMQHQAVAEFLRQHGGHK